MTRVPLADLPDVLTGPEAAAAIGIGRTLYFTLRRHQLFPLKPLAQPGDPRYSKASVIQHLEDRNELPRRQRRAS